MYIFIYIKNLPTVQGTQIQSLGWEEPLEKEMATHSNILASEIPGTEEPSRLQSMGSQKSRTWPEQHIRYMLEFMCKKKFWESIYESLIPGGTSRLPFRKMANLRASVIPWLGSIYLQWRKRVHSFKTASNSKQFKQNENNSNNNKVKGSKGKLSIALRIYFKI